MMNLMSVTGGRSRHTVNPAGPTQAVVRCQVEGRVRLSRAILHFSSRGLSRAESLRAILQVIQGFSTSNIIKVWLSDGDRTDAGWPQDASGNVVCFDLVRRPFGNRRRGDSSIPREVGSGGDVRESDPRAL